MLRDKADRMLERLIALRVSTQPSPSPAPRPDRNTTRADDDDDDDDDLPPLEPLDSGSFSSESLSSPETPSPVPVSSFYGPPSVATAATSRFSTVVGNRSQEQVLIDLASEDEYDENGDESSAADLVEPALVVDELSQRSEGAASSRERVMVWRDNNATQESSPPAQTTETGILGMPADLDIGPQTIANDSVNDDSPTHVSPMHHERDQPEHDAEPPFVTDGRGRVVWSRMRSARGAQAVVPRESLQPPQVAQAGTIATERRTKSRRPAQDSNSVAGTTGSSAFMTDGRGRVIWTGPPVQADAAVDGDGEMAATEVDAENEDTEPVVTAAEPSRSGPRRSFFGRVYDVVFS